MKKLILVMAVLALLCVGVAANAADVTGSVYGSYSPLQETNTTEWNSWFANASAAIVAGQNSGGTSYATYTNVLDPAGNGQFDVNGLMVTNQTIGWLPAKTSMPAFNSWMGTATNDGMYGNRFAFMYDLQGTDLDIRNVSLSVDTNFVGKYGSTDWTGNQAGSFSSDTVGFGAQLQDTRSGYDLIGGNWVEVTSGFVADRIIIRSAFGWNPDNIVGATNQQMLDGLEQQLLGEKPWSDSGAYRMLYSYDLNVKYDSALVTSGEITNAAVPEPMSIMLGIMGLGSVAGFKRLRRS